MRKIGSTPDSILDTASYALIAKRKIWGVLRSPFPPRAPATSARPLVEVDLMARSGQCCWEALWFNAPRYNSTV